jgi:hypothetical protein
MSFLLSSTVYSQRAQVSSPGDTILVFSVWESRELLRKLFVLEEYKELFSVCDQQRALLNNIYSRDSLVKIQMKRVINNCNETIKLQRSQLDLLAKYAQDQSRSIRRQKFYKWAAILVGTTATGFLSYKYITK